MINKDKPHVNVEMIGKCYEEAISQTGVRNYFDDLLN